MYVTQGRYIDIVDILSIIENTYNGSLPHGLSDFYFFYLTCAMHYQENYKIYRWQVYEHFVLGHMHGEFI